eukprot:TRINITY_DN5781_c0_g1_i2.p1 TRINITY_DN5781_c0_g1~~TRINITY_DN5781_c0_g1_i2.p1  ORF type:complete len:204 (-),score=44.96 TRINITY_DN5781_c0_g1_i2:33-644(-)
MTLWSHTTTWPIATEAGQPEGPHVLHPLLVDVLANGTFTVPLLGTPPRTSAFPTYALEAAERLRRLRWQGTARVLQEAIDRGTLQGKVGLEVTVYVPSTRGSAAITEEEQAAHVQEVALALSQLAGGATATAGVGYWVDQDTAQLVQERVTLVSSCVAPAVASRGVAEALARLGWLLCDALHQQAVMLKVNSEVRLIFCEPPP